MDDGRFYLWLSKTKADPGLHNQSLRKKAATHRVKTNSIPIAKKCLWNELVCEVDKIAMTWDVMRAIGEPWPAA